MYRSRRGHRSTAHIGRAYCQLTALPRALRLPAYPAAVRIPCSREMPYHLLRPLDSPLARRLQDSASGSGITPFVLLRVRCVGLIWVAIAWQVYIQHISLHAVRD